MRQQTGSGRMIARCGVCVVTTHMADMLETDGCQIPVSSRHHCPAISFGLSYILVSCGHECRVCRKVVIRARTMRNFHVVARGSGRKGKEYNLECDGPLKGEEGEAGEGVSERGRVDVCGARPTRGLTSGLDSLDVPSPLLVSLAGPD